MSFCVQNPFYSLCFHGNEVRHIYFILAHYEANSPMNIFINFGEIGGPVKCVFHLFVTMATTMNYYRFFFKS